MNEPSARTGAARRIKAIDHPAKRLYRTWEMVLDLALTEEEFRTGVGIHFGTKNDWGLSWKEGDSGSPDRISFGYLYKYGWNEPVKVHWPVFEVAANGEWRFTRTPHGWKQRDEIASNTFLSWQHFIGGYQWALSEDRKGHYYDSWRTGFEERVGYMPDRMMGGRWMELRPWEGGWDAAFSARSLRQWDHLADLQAWHDQVREKRWKWAHLARQRNLGLAPPSKHKPMTVYERQERAEQRLAKSALTIAAHLNVSEPANARRSRAERAAQEAKKEAACLELSGHL